MYLATICTDTQWPTDEAAVATDNWRYHRRAPFFTWGNAWFNAPCATWPAAAGTPVPISGTGYGGPVLLLNEEFDAATPYAGALAVRRLFPTASLIKGEDGTTHASALSGIRCVDRSIAKFLADGSTPRRKAGKRADRTCPGVPPPRVEAPGVEAPGVDARSPAVQPAAARWRAR
jgi:hypothetical protein